MIPYAHHTCRERTYIYGKRTHTYRERRSSSMPRLAIPSVYVCVCVFVRVRVRAILLSVLNATVISDFSGAHVCMCVYTHTHRRWCNERQEEHRGIMPCVALRCSVLQYVEVCCSILRCGVVCCSVMQCVVLQCMAVCWSVLCYSVL